MSNTDHTAAPPPHLSLQDTVELLQAYGWNTGQITAITAQVERDWVESRERAYRLADYNDARAARRALINTPTASSSSSSVSVSRPKAKRVRVAPGTGTASMFD